jgi:hypothetical protein
MIKPAVCVAAAVVLAGCGRSSDRPLPQISGLTPIPTLLELESSGIEERSRRIVARPGQWDTVWTEITRNGRVSGPRPEIDFRREMLALATSEVGTPANLYMRFEGYRFRADTMEVYLLLNVGTEDCPLPDLVANPFLIGRLPRWDKPIEFHERQTERCGSS